MTYALKAADELAKEGVEAEVIDFRTLRPMDTETIINSDKTGPRRDGGRGLAAVGRRRRSCCAISENAFDYLDAPVARVSGKDVPMPRGQPR